jgi:bacterioferritin
MPQEDKVADKKNPLNKEEVVKVLNRILELELAGVVRYTHYSLMVYGYNRIPIVSWLREQANEALAHAQKAGEWITTLGEHPSLAVGPLLESHKHEIGQILKESRENESDGMEQYLKLLGLVEGNHVALEEYAREMILAEELHLSEVDKMLRPPAK